ncbi:MAG: helix-turn-helix domain-containing protein [Alphaproteobacteria bacterium]|nr:helix-turn-helix domain-containing protein [Alphaproteobacteria bacterium]
MREEGARRELAEFLKTRRTRLAPAAFGFPSGERRRTPGLRREEVAALAGVGLTWYTWLEQGKPIQVSTAFLENLARALKLSEAERSHLFALAQHRLPPLPRSDPPSERTEHVQSILEVIESPAYARSSRFDVIAWNRANTRMFGDFAAIPASERNALWLMFARTYHRRTMPSWEADARSLVANFRINLGRAGDAGAFLSLVAELNAVSADFRRIWAEHDVSDPGEGVTRFSSPRHGDLLFRHHSLRPDALPDLRIIVFIPATP